MQDPVLQNALQAHQAGNFADAARLYSDVLRADPKNLSALYLFGMLQTHMGRNDAAMRLFDEVLKLNPGFPQAQYQRGNLLLNSGHLAEALASYDAALRLEPDVAEVLNAKGVALTQLGRGEEAIEFYRRALSLNPDSAAVLNNHGNALLALKRYDEAVAFYDRALAGAQSNPSALLNRGIALYFMGRFMEALASIDRFLSVSPKSADGLTQRGLCLASLGRHAEALESFGSALAFSPRDTEILCNRGNSLLVLGRLGEALADFDLALSVNPNTPHALVNKGVILSRLRRHEEALVCFDRALMLTPDYTDALYNRANTLSVLTRFEDAIPDCEKVLAADPDYPYARGVLITCKLYCCDWRDLDEHRREISRGISQGRPVLNPQQNMPVSSSAAEQLLCARGWVDRESPPAPAPLWRGEAYRHERIRIAYLSADFHTHATAHLMAGLFEAHDRNRFEIHGVDFGPDDGSPMRSRLKNAIEQVHDIRTLDDRAAASFLREKEIDIAVDLKGYTERARTGIFSFRPAPLQVNYLGFPGTMGADYIDYIIADRTLIPSGEEQHYREKVVALPHSYQCNDDKRPIGPTASRAEAGLPEKAFVFCCFNNSYKTMPETFDIWMRLLKQVEGSVLWLLRSNSVVVRNLRREAEERGVTPDRLIFASHAPLAEHLGRLRLASLALDTLPYNAHTTGSDALWAGLPMVTLLGTTFAGRVGASLLNAVGLPELVTKTAAEYEALALRLATDSDALAAVKAKLLANRDEAPLFDTDRFRRALEAAYMTMWERSQRGDGPASFAVPS